MASYPLKKHSVISDREIGEMLGKRAESAVVKAYQRFSQRMSDDVVLSREVDKLKGKVFRVRGCYPN